MLGFEPRALNVPDKVLYKWVTSPEQRLLARENLLSQVYVLQIINPLSKMGKRNSHFVAGAEAQSI